MATSMVALRYSRALLDIGIERKSFEQLGRELDRLSAVFESPELRELFRNPKFKLEQRKSVLTELLRRLMVSPICRNFAFLLADRGRIGLIAQIAEGFHQLADEHAGRVRAQVTVAVKLGEFEAGKLKAALQKLTGLEVTLEQTEDPSIIGGVIARVGDRVYDGSVRAQLTMLRTQLLAQASR